MKKAIIISILAVLVTVSIIALSAQEPDEKEPIRTAWILIEVYDNTYSVKYEGMDQAQADVMLEAARDYIKSPKKLH